MKSEKSETEKYVITDGRLIDVPVVDPQQYRYHLPEDRIAQFPLEQRDGSKL